VKKEEWNWLRIIPAMPFAVAFWLFYIPSALLLRAAMAISGAECSFDLFDVEVRWTRK
jgi:hypothetical protein